MLSCSYELIGTFLHLPGGIVATVVRFSISYFDMALAFGRLDVPISLSHPADDPGHAAYMAAILCDIKFNSPFSRFGTSLPKLVEPFVVPVTFAPQRARP